MSRAASVDSVRLSLSVSAGETPTEAIASTRRATSRSSSAVLFYSTVDSHDSLQPSPAKAPKPKRKDSTSTELYLVHQGFALLHSLAKYGFYAWMVYWAYRAVEALAGRTTIVNALVSAFFSRDNDFGLPWVMAGAFAMWALAERKIRRNKTDQMQRHIKTLEERIDPKRTSSGLLPTGVHRPEDEL